MILKSRPSLEKREGWGTLHLGVCCTLFPEVGMDAPAKKRKSGIPSGNAGEYFVMAELLRRGYDAQLADRNTKGYDLLVGLPSDTSLRKVQVKTCRAVPWYVNRTMFEPENLDLVTIYVLLGSEKCDKPIRYFIAKNRKLAKHAHYPNGWPQNGFMRMKALEPFENKWEILFN